MGRKVFQTFNYIFLFMLGIVTLYPFIYFLVLSFNDGQDAIRGGIYFFPRVFSLENYKMALNYPHMANAFGVTVMRTAIGTVLSLLLTTAMAYSLVYKDLPGRTVLIFFFFFTTVFSGGIIPSYILMRQLNLINSFWVYVLPLTYDFFNVIIFRTFFEGIPGSLQEAATIDGCGLARIFWKIYLPLSAPVIATVALFVGVMHWNDWFQGAFFITRPELKSAATLLQQILSEANFEQSEQAMRSGVDMISRQRSTTSDSLQMTFVVIITTPIVLVYPFIQRFFVKGVMVGAIKS